MDIVRLEGYDDCIIGLATCFGKDDAFAYCEDKLVQKIMDSSDMDVTEAILHLELNLKENFYGEGNPVFVKSLQKYEIEEFAETEGNPLDLSEE